MCALASRRQYENGDAFVREFLDTLTPGVIPTDCFIDWDQIDAALASNAEPIRFLRQYCHRRTAAPELRDRLADALLAADDPLPFLACAFHLLGHTTDRFVADKEDLSLSKVATAISAGSEDEANHVSQLLMDMGLSRVITRSSLEDVLAGVEIGLQTHRRKNVGGYFFICHVETLLNDISKSISKQSGSLVRVYPERRISLPRGTSKKVDFALDDGHTVVAVEVNFYTVPGSKPTEIKRSYADVQRALLSHGVILIWITDGSGYRKMKRSLANAFNAFRNIYNFHQARTCLASDLLPVFQRSK